MKKSLNSSPYVMVMKCQSAYVTMTARPWKTTNVPTQNKNKKNKKTKRYHAHTHPAWSFTSNALTSTAFFG